MFIFTHNKFKGYYSVGTAAVVLSDSSIEAAEQLEKKLEELGFTQEIDPDDMEIMSRADSPKILCDGNY